LLRRCGGGLLGFGFGFGFLVVDGDAVVGGEAGQA
jgi:hypothetical protein